MRQRQALAVMLGKSGTGESVFLTGPPGAGKTYVLNEFIRRAQRQHKTVAVTASTGIAATHIGGTTIHSWSGLGVRESLSEWDRERLLTTDRLIKRYNATDILVIDEVSMLHGRRLDMVNEACKILRKNDAPFGGLQVILVGDLFQLPPINRGSELVDFAHTSDAWQELNPKICYLTEQHRQEQSDGLLDLLNAMRRGDVNELHEMMLTERLGVKPEKAATVTRLYSHNADVESINQKHLSAIDSETKMFIMQSKGTAAKIEQLTKSVLAPERLELKKGAEVMFVANNYAQGFANGSRGHIVGFRDNLPVVELSTSERQIKVEPHTWTLEEDGRKRAEVSQLPLRLAWAITIHKSQGMSLDAAEIDLSRSFTPGMGYVALSRVRSLDGVFLGGINQMALAMHPQIFAFDSQLREASDEIAGTVDDLPEEAEPELSASSGSVGAESEAEAFDVVLFNKLRAWRAEQASEKQLPPYVIAHDSVLQEVARRSPKTTQALLGLKGFGPKRVESYGEDIVGIVLAHVPVGVPEKTADITQISTQARGGSEDMIENGKNIENTDDVEGAEVAEDAEVAAIRTKLRAAILAEYPRAGKRWSPEEDAVLLEQFADGKYLQEVCDSLERSPSSIWTRLGLLLNQAGPSS